MLNRFPHCRLVERSLGGELPTALRQRIRSMIAKAAAQTACSGTRGLTSQIALQRKLQAVAQDSATSRVISQDRAENRQPRSGIATALPPENWTV